MDEAKALWLPNMLADEASEWVEYYVNEFFLMYSSISLQR